MLRILAVLALLFSVLFMPFWVSVVLALAGMAYFSFFLEAVFLFLLLDFLYGTKEAELFSSFFSFIIILICFIIFELFKKKLRLNPK